MSSLESLKATFKGDIVTPSDPGYEEAISRWAKNAERRAKYVAFVKDAEDVRLALDLAKSEKIPLAIKGGGHNAAGASSSEGGLIIDLSRYLARVTVDPVKKLGYVGGGAVWKTVDEAGIEHGLATVGGTVNHVRLIRLTLGGGYGWLSGEHGLAIDNLVQANVVTGDGSILTANKDENSDLFWAIRGGGCNFGVVTEFVFQLHDQRRTVYSGPMIFPGPLIKGLIQTTNEWWRKHPSKKEGMLQVLTRGPPPKSQPCAVCFMFFNGSEQEGREAFKSFLDLKPIDLTSEMPYEKVNSLQNEVATPGQCVYMKGVNFSLLQPDEARILLDKIAELTEDSTFRVASIFEFFPPDKINSVPNDATAMNNRSFQKNVLTSSFWDENTPVNQKTGRQKVYTITELITNVAKDADVLEKRGYGNYSDESSTSDRSAVLFGANYPRLQDLKRKYDPDLLFRSWFPITPAKM
ncbi:FAD-binding domain-containing protein [Fomitiporia mediterranea MF3/22]|uniref:FAD-binding domain-containing protein n=1 Tax=Fomitiporia mediterranea (strain MF3/22) TaxID=694068 RepID=UPI0004407BA5|nr:FAD-binding domain-containing protein [Fomitiporia mediterranea MF3/22]EJD01265.1 FAD-binding domain-containing protein [Fomitiporia mediterranea MF3/22]